MKAEKNGERLLVYLNGEIDHCCAEQFRREIETLLRDRSIRQLTLDFSRVSFMDSSGIGMVLGRYKRVSQYGGSVTIRNAGRLVKQILDMSGVFTLMSYEDTRGEE